MLRYMDAMADTTQVPGRGSTCSRDCVQWYRTGRQGSVRVGKYTLYGIASHESHCINCRGCKLGLQFMQNDGAHD